MKWTPHPVVAAAVAGALYYGAAWLGLRMAVFPETASPIWPATGIAVAALTLLGLRAWPAIAAAVFLVELPAFGAPLSVLLAAGNTAEAVLAAAVLRRLGGATAFTRGSAIGWFLVGAAAACLASTAAAVYPLHALGGTTPLAQLVVTWYLGDLMGAVLVAPPLVLVARPVGALVRSASEWTAFVAVTLATAFVAFYPWRSGEWSEIRLGFLVLGPIVWAASRFGPPVTAWSSLLLTLAALGGLAAGALELAAERNAALLQLQLLAGLMGTLGLYLAAAVHERNRTIALLADQDRMKTRFLNKAAHELRTPLTPLRLQVHNIARREDLPEPDQKALAIVRRSTDRMTHIIDRLLRAARVDEEARAAERHEADLFGIVEEAVEQIDRQDHELDVDATGKAILDRDAAVQILVELLSNAVRHAQRKVLVEARPLPDGGGRFVVTDDGPGIPTGRRQSIFDPFTHGEDDGAGEGVGVGLYMARAIAAGRGGMIAVDTGPDGGARFTVELPVS